MIPVLNANGFLSPAAKRSRSNGSGRLLRIAIQISFQWLPALSGACNLARAQNPTCGASPNVLAEFKIHGDGDALVLPVRLGDVERLFLVDTGSSLSAFDVSLAPLLGRQRGCRTVHTLAATVERPTYDAPRGALIGRLPMPEGGVVVTYDLEPIRRASGHGIYGVVGMDFLKAFVLDVSLDNATLRFLDGAPQTDVKAIPLEFVDDVPFVVAHIDAVYRKRFVLDTGYYSAASAGLSTGPFDRLLNAARKKAEHQGGILTAFVGEMDARRLVRFGLLSVGEAVAVDVDIDEARADMLGIGFFVRFSAVFDFPNHALFLTPGRRAALPDRRDTFGLHIWRIGEGVCVRSVDHASPAAKIGMMAGDVLTRVNGQPVSKLRLHQIRLLFRRENEAIRLEFRRDGTDRIENLNLRSR